MSYLQRSPFPCPVEFSRSASADLVIFGLAEKDLHDFQGFLDSRDALLAKLPQTILVRSTGEVDLLA